MRVMIAFCILVGTAASAGEGGSCGSDGDCKPPLTCVAKKSKGKGRCQRVCDPLAPRCPEDTRCVKDGEASVCLPINDGRSPPRLP